MSLLTVDIKSEFGAFNNPESNVGGLMSYKIPTKTAIQGFLGAVLGLSFKDTIEFFDGLKYTAKPKFNFDSVNITYNSHYGGRKGRMVNVQQELLINPHYKIYLDFGGVKEDNNSIIEQIKNNFSSRNIPNEKKQIVQKLLREKQNYYTPYMGKREFPLEYELSSSSNIKELEESVSEKFSANTAVPIDAIKNYEITTQSEEDNDGSLFSNMSIEEEVGFEVFHINQIPTKQDKKRNFIDFENLVLKKPKGTTSLKVLIDKGADKYNFYLDRNKLVVCF
jgi:CRISPR-associated Cas5-like protein